ncbi:MAG: hypothetical protein ACRCX4_01990 [Bacteroidales bacterium]
MFVNYDPFGGYYCVGIGPSWGFRRVWDHFMLDLSFNPAVGVDWGGPVFFARLKLGLMYRF